jgi:hypothetical protein
MLSTSSESPDEDEGAVLHDVSLREPSAVDASLQDDVERLLEIAGQLFSAIERQIHRIEEELTFAGGEEVRAYAQTVFKERLINCAESLEMSIQEIGFHLQRRADEHIVTYGLREDPDAITS